MGIWRWYFECCDSLRMSSMLGEDIVSGQDGRRMHRVKNWVMVVLLRRRGLVMGGCVLSRGWGFRSRSCLSSG